MANINVECPHCHRNPRRKNKTLPLRGQTGKSPSGLGGSFFVWGPFTRDPAAPATT